MYRNPGKALVGGTGTEAFSAGIHAVNAIVTEGLNRDRIEPP